jgi:hypothetical protein
VSGRSPAAIRAAPVTEGRHGVRRRNAQSGLSGPSGQIIAGRSRPAAARRRRGPTRRDVNAARRVLLRFIERHGALEDTLARRAGPEW